MILSLVLFDNIIDRIVYRIKNIMTLPQLLNVLRELEWDIKSSLITEVDMAEVLGRIEYSLRLSARSELASLQHCSVKVHSKIPLKSSFAVFDAAKVSEQIFRAILNIIMNLRKDKRLLFDQLDSHE